MDPDWQKINEACHYCHSWPILDRRRITAMTTFALLIALIALTVALVRYARHDHFAGPGNLADNHDELGSLHQRSRIVPQH